MASRTDGRGYATRSKTRAEDPPEDTSMDAEESANDMSRDSLFSSTSSDLDVESTLTPPRPQGMTRRSPRKTTPQKKDLGSPHCPPNEGEVKKKNKLYPDLPVPVDKQPEKSPFPAASPRRPARGPISYSASPNSANTRGIRPKGYCTQTLCFGIVVGLLVVLACLYCFNPWITPVESRNNTTLERFTVNLKELKGRFPSQSSRFWSVMSAATKRIIVSPEPIQPAVLLLAAPTGAHDVADCVAKHFAKAVTASFDLPPSSHTHIECDAYRNEDHHEVKLSLDSQLTAGFGKGRRVALLTRLQHIPAHAAMLLHAYCDNENAPHKKAVFVFTLPLDHQGSVLKDGPESDAVVEDYLSRVWSEMKADDRGALYSRIANSVGIVRAESSETFTKHCT